MESKRMLKSAVLCLLVGTCFAQFPQRQQNPFFQQQYQQPQQRFNQQQQPRNFNQQQQQQNYVQQNSISQPKQQNFGGQCPEPNGRFPVASQCDAYIECKDGVAEEKLCPEGLLFNPEARFNYPCGYPIDVKCEGRSALQPANPTEECPHQYGYFKVGDRTNCGKFMNCVEGRGYVFDCPEGLAYNPETYRCDWPDQVSDCDAEAFLGFTCPTSGQHAFLNSEARFYRSPNDCQRYYVCVEGRPRLQNCGEGNAFSELIGTCDAAENVTGCEHAAIRKDVQTNLDDPQIDIRSHNNQQQHNTFNQAKNFGGFNQAQSHRPTTQQQNSFNQAHNFGGQQQHQQQQFRGSQTYRNPQGNNNPFFQQQQQQQQQFRGSQTYRNPQGNNNPFFQQQQQQQQQFRSRF